MKFTKKSPVIICTFLILFFNVNNGFCSDNITLPGNMPAVIQNNESDNTKNVATPKQLPTSQTKSKVQTSAESTEKTSTYKTDNTAPDSLTKMITGLVKVISLIVFLAILYVLYRRFKSGKSLFKMPGNRESSSEKNETSKNRPPSDVSEAVTSFIRHKIK